MKIGFFGNTNNYPFMLARAFRRMGHAVTVVIHRRERLHRPEFRYADIVYPYPDWIREILFPDEASFVGRTLPVRESLRLLRDCDFVVLNDLGVSLAERIGRPYLALLTGSDLTYYCDPGAGEQVLSAMTTRNPLKRLRGRWIWRRLLQSQRTGVRQANLVWHFARGLVPAGDALLDDLGVQDSRRLFCLMAETADLPATPPPNNSPMRTFCATRLTWRKPHAGDMPLVNGSPLSPRGGLGKRSRIGGYSPLDFKGSDVMIRGLGMYIQQFQSPLDIHLVRKGKDVAETIALADSLDLTRYITWHEEMTQAEIWRQYALSDLVFEQFDEGIVAMAGLEAMAAGRPVVANGRPDLLEPLLGEPSPVCQATTPEQIAEHLRSLSLHGELRAQIGLQSRQWVERHFRPETAAEKILARI